MAHEEIRARAEKRKIPIEVDFDGLSDHVRQMSTDIDTLLKANDRLERALGVAREQAQTAISIARDALEGK